MAEQDADILVLTSEIVSAYLSNNSMRSEEVPGLIRTIRTSLLEESAPKPETAAEPEIARPTPAQVRKSVQPHALTSFVDGKPYKTLKRHLTRHGMTFPEYREKYGLPKDYPSVAPDYSASRSAMAKSLGLGARGRGGKGAAPAAEAPTPTPKAARGRKAAPAPAA